MGNGIGGEKEVRLSSIYLSHSWAHKICPRPTLLFHRKNLLQFWCVVHWNASPHHPGVCNQPRLHVPADAALENSPGAEVHRYSRNHRNARHLGLKTEIGKDYCYSTEGMLQRRIHCIAQIKVQRWTVATRYFFIRACCTLCWENMSAWRATQDTFDVGRYVGWGCILNCFTSCYIFNVFYSC